MKHQHHWKAFSETRIEIKNALLGDYGTDTRISNTTGDEFM